MTTAMTLARAEKILGVLLSAASTREHVLRRGYFFASDGACCAVGLGLVYTGIERNKFAESSPDAFAKHYECSTAFADGVSAGFEDFPPESFYRDNEDYQIGYRVGTIVAEVALGSADGGDS